MFNLNPEHLSVHFNEWVNLLNKESYLDTNLDTEVLERLKSNTLSLEDVYQDVLLGNLKDTLSNGELDEFGFFVYYEIDGKNSKLFIEEEWGENLWEITSAESLNKALDEIEKIKQKKANITSFVLSQLNDLSESKLVDLWNMDR